MATLTSKQTAEALGVSPATLEKWRRSGKDYLPFRYVYWEDKPGVIKGVEYEEEDIINFLTSPPPQLAHRVTAMLRLAVTNNTTEGASK